RISDQDAEQRDVEAQHQRSPGQEAVKVLLKKGHILTKAEDRFGVAHWHLGQEAEIQHHGERQDHRNAKPHICWRGETKAYPFTLEFHCLPSSGASPPSACIRCRWPRQPSRRGPWSGAKPSVRPRACADRQAQS